MSINKILVWSNHPAIGSGYGVEANQFIKAMLKLGYNRDQIGIGAFHGQQHFVSEWDGMRVYGCGEENYGGDIVGDHARHFGADLVVTIMDIWALDHTTLAGLNVAAWMPVDAGLPAGPDVATRPPAEGLSQYDFQRLSAARNIIPVAVSRFGQGQLQAAGFDALYVPHFIDTEVFKPFGNRDEVRKEMNITGLFAVTIASANRDKSRKAYPAQLEAFRRFHARHRDSVLMIHADQRHRLGHDLPLLLDRIGLPKNSYRFSNQYLLKSGQIPEWRMAGTFAAADLGLQAAMAEGFGLPAAEVMSCGIPVIATHGSAMIEVAGPGGWLVRGEKAWADGHMSWWIMPNQDDMVKALCQAYHGSGRPVITSAGGQKCCKEGGSRVYVAKKARARPHIEENYSVPVVTEQWRQALTEIERRMR